jgi:hypothetical protein
MAEKPTSHPGFIEAGLDHMEAEIRALEGRSRWKRWAGWAFVALFVAVIVGAFVWFVMSPPPVTSAGR